MRSFPRTTFAALIIAVSISHFGAALAEEATSLGARIYLNGISTSAQPIVARVENNVLMSGERVACVRCHRRSGLGSSEAAVLIPPIAGPILFQAKDMHSPMQESLAVSSKDTRGARPAYKKDTLALALREGIGSGGHPLNPLMPRYELKDEDVSALISYLNTLASGPDPGVDDDEIHFASIIMPGVSGIQRKAVVDVLETFFQDRNAATRHEPNRAEHTPWHLEWSSKSYRKWVLHLWELTGPPSAWPQQLEGFYRKQPVFAIAGGVGSGAWRPIHEFCERNRIPCLFPSTDLPVVDEEGNYSIYFSKGLLLEAEALASYLAQQHEHNLPQRRIIQVFRDDEQGLAVSSEFRNTLHRLGVSEITDVVFDNNLDKTLSRLRDAPSHDHVIVVYWLDAQKVRDLVGNAGIIPENAERFFSSTLLDVINTPLPLQATLGKGYLIHPFALYGKRKTQISRGNIWLKSKKIALADQRLQADAYFVATLLRGAVKKIQGNFSRDYFIERIEHMVENTLTPSVYPRLSLGPGQRFASKGCYIIALEDAVTADETVKKIWITP